MEKPKVSILLVTYNRPEFIARSIMSALEQTWADWELIIVDDSEDHATETIAKTFVARDGRIKYFHRERKGTIANASNFGLSHSQGEYVAILDDDDRWADKEKLEKQVKFLEAHPDHVGCGGGLVLLDDKDREISRILKPENDDAIRRRALYANPIANSTSMFRRSAGVAYDESLPQFADFDFWLTLGTKGKLYNFPAYFVYYRMGRSGSSFVHQKDNARSALIIVKRHRGEYPHFLLAVTMGYAYSIYAALPQPIRNLFNAPLSRLKKNTFSA